MKAKKDISPSISKIAQIFEKTEKVAVKDIEKETNIEKLKGVFEDMMEKSRSRKGQEKKSEKKKRKRTLTGEVDLKPQGRAIEKWLKIDREIDKDRQEKIGKEKREKSKVNEKWENKSVKEGPKSESQSIHIDLVRNVSDSPKQFKGKRNLLERHSIKGEKEKIAREKVEIKTKGEDK